MLRLNDVKVYTDGFQNYRLIKTETFDTEVEHTEIIKWAILYAFSSKMMYRLFKNIFQLFGNGSNSYHSTLFMEDGTIIVLVINNDFTGGVQDYEDWRKTI